MVRTTECTPKIQAGRLAKARQFMDAADMIDQSANDADDISDAFVTLCVHAGIAAADVICCRRLGEHSSGEDHAVAVALLAKADTKAAKQLRTLLGMKTKAGYSSLPVNSKDYKRASRAARSLVDAAIKA